MQILRNKNLTTRFQILVEIADKGPLIHQRTIARELAITPQAVSEYIAQLVKEGLLKAEGRSKYRLTPEGVNWVIQELRLLDNYNNFAQRAINNISVCTAIAETEIAKNKKVGLKMKNGLLYAVTQPGSETSAITVTSAGRGEDIGVSNIQGIIPLMIGRVSIIKIPGVERGGSRQVDYDLLTSYAASSSPIVSLGLEAYVTLQKASLPFQHFGSGEALIEATRSGLNPLAVCAEGESSLLINRLAEAKVEYRLIDAGHGTASC